MRGELAKLHDQLQTTVIYVTHDQLEAMTLADQIVVMNKGRIMQIGSPREVYNNPRNMFVAGFIGSPSMNFFKVKVVEEGGSLSVVGDGFKLLIKKDLEHRYMKLKDQEVILGIRPEHIYDKRLKGAFPDGQTLRASIEVVEPVGAETILLARSGSNRLTIRADCQMDATPHCEMEFVIDVNKMHVFNLSGEQEVIE